MADFNNFSYAETESHPLISQYSFITKPQVAEDLFDVRPNEMDIGTFMKAGLMKRYKGEEIVHNEANKVLDAPFVNTSVTQANVYGTATFAGIPNVDYIQLAPASHTPVNGPYAGKKSSPRVGMLIQFKNLSVWRIIGKDEANANAHRVYITRVNATQAPYNATLSATITNNGGTYGGNQFSLFASAFEEATYGMQKGLVPTFTSHKNHFQTFSERYDVTDWASQTETYPLKWKDKTLNFVYVKGIGDTEDRFILQEHMGLFLTPKDDGNLYHINPDGTTSTVTTTQGFLPQLQLSAQKLYHNNAPTMAIWDTIVRLKKKLYQDRKSVMWYGYEFGFQIKEMINDFGVDGALVYNRKAIDLGFNMIEVAGHEFAMKEMEILGHPDITALTDFPYPNYFIVAPTNKIQDAKRTDVMHDAFTIMYKEMEGRGARGHYKIWDTGGNTEAGTDSQLIRRVHIASRKGMQVVGASRFILGKPTA